MSSGRRAAIWSRAALADLDATWDYYIRVAGENTADRLPREIGRVVGVIETHPYAGRACDELSAGIRSIAAAPHVVFIASLGKSHKSFACATAATTSMRYLLTAERSEIRVLPMPAPFSAALHTGYGFFAKE